MALQLGALRDALIDGGTSVDKANKAAEEVASYEKDVASIRGELTALKWMVGTLITMVILVLGGEMALWSKLGEIGSKVIGSH